MNNLFSGDISRRSFMKAALSALPVLFISPYSAIGGKRPLSVRRTTFAMGTIISIEAFGTDEKQINHAITRCFDSFHHLDVMMSVYNDSSSLSEVNRNAGKNAVIAPKELREVIGSAQILSRETGGAFDITLEPLMKLWGFREEGNVLAHIPTDKDIRIALESSGMKNILIENESIYLSHPNSRIDLGGIAVGYSVDKAAQILRSEGIEAAFINHSGDVYALGAPPDTDGWKCVIPNPQHPNEFIKEFTITNSAVSTSARYEKFVTSGGKNYGHILDAKTGRPSEVVMSTTVITNASIESDTLSTAYYTMNAQEGLASAQKRPNTKLITSTLEGDLLKIYTS